MTIKIIDELERKDGTDKPIARANRVSVDTTNFDKNLSSADTDVQKALETLDELVASGGSYDIRDGSYIWPDEATSDAYYAANPTLLIEGAERMVALQIQDFNSSYLAIGVP